ncbi:MAG: hypothetical protein MJ102_04310 [Clostridia bacterium]|nr:hypothetical protein [Clostridia bacterium]
MSNRSHNSNRSETKLWVRILSLFLAVLMVLSVAYIAVSFIISAFAADNDLSEYAMISSVGARNFYISAGVRYGSSVSISNTYLSRAAAATDAASPLPPSKVLI